MPSRVLTVVPTVAVFCPLLNTIETFVGEIRRFGKGLTAYVGLDPQLHQSGRTVQHQAAISRQGDPTLRQLLFMGALGGIRSRTSALRLFYDRLLAAGKPKMVALVAAARKILVWAWSVFRDGAPFDSQLAQARAKAPLPI